MARPHKVRKLLTPPLMAGFRPFGMARNQGELIKLSFEEFESLKIINYDKLSQDEAAALMNISRPTFTRIYNKALQTIAVALVEGRPINIEGGKGKFETEWFRCNQCNKLIAGIESHIRCSNCSHFSTNELQKLV